MNATAVDVNIDVADVRVAFHCEQSDDAASYRIEHDKQSIYVYLTGTPEQLAEFAQRILATVSQRAIAEVVRAGTEAVTP